MKSTTTCPRCGSDNTTGNLIDKQGECLDCDAKFELGDEPYQSSGSGSDEW